MILILLLQLSARVFSEVAYYGYAPKGANPTLYSPDDSVLQLDESTFNDTLFGNDTGDCGFIVEFYSDWCGHCRHFAPIYKNLAKDVEGWKNIVKVAAINCADSVNEHVCKSNGVRYFPLLKYFPREASNYTSGFQIKPYPTVSEMRGQLTKAVMDDYLINRYQDWPTFEFLKDVVTYGELWNDTALSANHIAIIFEANQASLTGAQLILDLSSSRDRMIARRCLKSHPLADALKLTDFPSLAIFKRGERRPVLVAELRRLLLREIDMFLGKTDSIATNSIQFSSRKNKTVDCNNNPELCKPNYYVSEVDMLKAMRYALYRESSRNEGMLQGANLSALYSFVSLLADHFPTTTLHGSPNNSSTLYLNNSVRAAHVFSRLRDFISEKGLDAKINPDEWQKEFIAAEKEAGNPFPQNAEWDHCAGSSSQFRGYTCGLWTTFHTLTVASYKNWVNKLGDVTLPLPPLQSIRDWVGSFFGCNHCREHFLKMTTDTYKIEANVRRPEDVFLYLWKAHNRVNARLRGRDTEDPKFPKYQFPAAFLCADCNVNGTFNEVAAQEFLLDYYSNIKPFIAKNAS